MMVFHYLGRGTTQATPLNEAEVDTQAAALGEDAVTLWEAIKEAARREANRGMTT